MNKQNSVNNCYELCESSSLSFTPGGLGHGLVHGVGVRNLNANSWLVQIANPLRTGLLFYSLESQVVM